MSFTAQFFDGESPREHEATVTASESFLTINYLENGFRKAHSFRISEVEAEPDGKNVIITFEGKTLILPAEAWKKIGRPHRERSWNRFLIPASMCITLVVSLIVWHDLIVKNLSTFVPDKFMDKIGESVNKEFKTKNCLTKEQEQIVESVFMRLGRNRDEFTFYLIPSTEENAFAMPGKVIVFHDAIFKRIDSMEGFAGILAHEIAHVEEEHVKRQLVKTLLFKWASFAVFGNSDNGLISSIIAGKYNQAEEQEADILAAKTLEEADVSPKGAQKFFADGEKKEDVFTKYLVLSHPAYSERVKTFTPKKKSYTPMRAEDWKVLSKGCQSNL